MQSTPVHCKALETGIAIAQQKMYAHFEAHKARLLSINFVVEMSCLLTSDNTPSLQDQAREPCNCCRI